MVDSFTLSIKSLAVDSFSVNKVLIVDSFTWILVCSTVHIHEQDSL